MKNITVVALGLICLMGFACAQFNPYSFPGIAPRTTSQGFGTGAGGFNFLVGILFVLLVLLSLANSNQNTFTFVNASG